MSENDNPIEGYDHLFYDSLTECFIIYLYEGATFIEICGKDRMKVAVEIHNMYYPETPSDIKTIY